VRKGVYRMSTYEERMAEKYGFFSKDDVPENKKINEDVSNEGELNTEKEVVVENTSSDNLLVPIEAWENVLKQLGNLHEANQLMAESRERAAKAEAEAEFLREKLKNTREELETSKQKRRFLFFK